MINELIKIYTCQEIAELLRLNYRTVRKDAKSGRLLSSVVSSAKSELYTEADVKKYMRGRLSVITRNVRRQNETA